VSGTSIPSTASSLGRLLSADTPQQYIVPDFFVPPYSSQTYGHEGQLGSNNPKSSNPWDTNPLTSISFWLYSAGLALRSQTATRKGSSQRKVAEKQISKPQITTMDRRHRMTAIL
jgi:hypothetical protein